MKLNIDEKRHKEQFDRVQDEAARIAQGAVSSALADGVATNANLAKFLAESRRVVEEEALLTVEAMTVAFDKKAEHLGTLRATVDAVTAQTAFMKSTLNTVEAKTVEIDRLTKSICAMNQSLIAFRSLVDDGTLDVISRAASALKGQP